MDPDRRPELRPEDVTWEELNSAGEGSWPLTGPNSHGGTTLYRYKGQLFTVGYGDDSSLPGGAEQVIAVRPDNTPGFPPWVGGGHAAGCRHEAHFGWDWWLHRTRLLRVEAAVVQLSVDGKEVWSCPLATFARPDSQQQADILRLLGPAVLDEALRCAARRLNL
jgi:hypothetical protein